jgi:hypothetical protein
MNPTRLHTLVHVPDERHGADQGHDAVLQGELVQQDRNGSDLVGRAIDAALALLTGPGAHQVQWRLALVHFGI